MGLADYQPEVRVIEIKGGSFQVKGLSLVEVTALIRTHLPDVEALLDLGTNVLDGKTELTQDDIGLLSVTLTEHAPGLVANLIAMASGEPGEAAVNNACRLPFPVQIKALTTIAELTFDEVGGIKKAMESVTGLLKKMPKSLPTRMAGS